MPPLERDKTADPAFDPAQTRPISSRFLGEMKFPLDAVDVNPIVWIPGNLGENRGESR